MTIAIWIIAIVEVIRIIQNTIQLLIVSRNNSNAQMKRATDALIQSFKKTDEEFVSEMVEKYKEKIK